MNLTDLKKNWDQFGREDPYWSILSDSSKKGNKWDEEEFFETGLRWIKQEVKEIKLKHPNFNFQSALDFGCGAGRLTQGLAQFFDYVSGVDIAPSMIKLANEKNNRENCKFYLNEKNDLSLFADEEFDYVYSIITLQHMQPKYSKNYISEFLRVLKPNGILTFQMPSKPDLGSQLYHHPLNKLRHKVGNYFNIGKGKRDAAIMEMYWIPFEEMVSFLDANGAKIIDFNKNNAAGDNWESFTYHVSKLSNNN